MNVHPIILASAVGVCLASPAGAELTSERHQEHLDSFDEVRSTIEARYPRPERLDEAWAARADSLRSRLQEADSEESVRAILIRLAHSLGDSHFEIIPAEHYETLYEAGSDDGEDDSGDPSDGDGSGEDPSDDENGSSSGDDDGSGEGADGASNEGDPEDSEDSEADGADKDRARGDCDDSADSDEDDDDDDTDDRPQGGVGLTVRLVNDRTVVTRVEPGSPADQAGLVPGDEIVSIGKKRMHELIDVVREVTETAPSRPETGLASAAMARLTGKVGCAVEVAHVDAAGDTIQTSMDFEAWTGVVTELGALPPQTVSTYSDDLGDIGVIGFSMFLAPGTVMPFLQTSLETFRDRDGIVIDLRGNVGGLLPMIQGIVGWFVSEPEKLGELTMRGTDLKLFANPRPWQYEGRVAVLTDEMSVSAAELFTAAMQDLEIARVFGGRTAGLALPANISKLPNGDGFLFVVADYHTASGRRLEQSGVTPDMVVEFTREDLYRDPDPVLSSAVEWIRDGSD